MQASVRGRATRAIVVEVPIGTAFDEHCVDPQPLVCTPIERLSRGVDRDVNVVVSITIDVVAAARYRIALVTENLVESSDRLAVLVPLFQIRFDLRCERRQPDDHHHRHEQQEDPRGTCCSSKYLLVH
jgi:hypothetical protein